MSLRIRNSAVSRLQSYARAGNAIPVYSARRPRKLSTVQKQQVKRLVKKNEELLTWDVYASVTSSSTGDFTDLTAMSDTQRNGVKVIPKSLEIKWHSDAGDSFNICRCLIIQWHVDSALVAPTLSQIFDTTTSSYLPQNPLNAEKVNQKKFTVLYDRTYKLIQNTTADPVLGSIKIYNTAKKKRMRDIYFNDGAVSSGRNKLYLIALSDSTAAPNPSINFTGHFQHYSP